MFSHISFMSIPVDDFDRAKAFYSDTMEMPVWVDAPYGPERWIMLQIPGARTMVHFEKRAGKGPPPRPVLALIAPDVAGVIERLRQKGTEIVSEPKAAEWDAETTYAMIRDSEGNIVLIASR